MTKTEKAYSERLKIGDTVKWCGTFGKDVPKDAKIVSILSKGREVTTTAWRTINKRRVIITFDSGHTTFASRLSKN
jgi:hypothetical protein